MATIARRLEREYPASNAGWGVELIGLQERIVGEIRPALLVFMGAVGLVLLIACANVANLMLARVAVPRARGDAFARRSAPRGGGWSASCSPRACCWRSPAAPSGSGSRCGASARCGRSTRGRCRGCDEIAVDAARAGLRAGAVGRRPGSCSAWCPPCGSSATTSGAAWRKAGADTRGARSAGAHPRRRSCSRKWPWRRCCWWARRCCSRASCGLQRIDPGFASHGMLTARVTLPRSRYDDPARQVAFADALLDRVRALPGVTVGGARHPTRRSATGRPTGRSRWPASNSRRPRWCRTPSSTGPRPTTSGRSPCRWFAAGCSRRRIAATRRPVALVSEALAQRYWPGGDPLGARITFGDPADSTSVWMTVVGVVGDVRQDGAMSPAYPQIYVPLRAALEPLASLVALRTAGDPLALAPAAQAGPRRRSTPTSRSAGSRRWTTGWPSTLARPRVNALLLAGFAATALMLAALGIYGVIAYSVVQRTRELGIRMALGARAEDVLRLVLRQGMAPVLAGLALGSGRRGRREPGASRTLLYGVGGTDPATYAGRGRLPLRRRAGGELPAGPPGGAAGPRRRAPGGVTMSLAIDPLIRLQGVSQIFHADEVETHALSRVDLEIRAGEYLAVCGPSGCGKTTLLSLLGLLDTPSEGSYVLAGEPVSTLSVAQRARVRARAIGFIFQAFNLIGDLTVYDNVELPLRYRGMPAEERRTAALAALDRVGLLHRLKHYPAQLSGGQQQRVAVARAVAGHPLVLLADEPTGNLDSTNGAEVTALLRELNEEGATLVVVTHDPRYLREARRTVYLYDGRLVPGVPGDREVA